MGVVYVGKLQVALEMCRRSVRYLCCSVREFKGSVVYVICDDVAYRCDIGRQCKTVCRPIGVQMGFALMLGWQYRLDLVMQPSVANIRCTQRFCFILAPNNTRNLQRFSQPNQKTSEAKIAD